ncbi:hypothetical protein C8J56DRAFT_1042772 [Mycena floridula]|nr:hypothetical protein C8J56DRAFT_1042772 [Mycena floridula]
MTSSNIRLAICGAGIAGLSLAIEAAKNLNLNVTIYESASQLTRLGAGIGFWPRAWEVFELMGIDKDVADVGSSKPTKDAVLSFQFRKGDDDSLIHEIWSQGAHVSLHRGDLQTVLLQLLPSTCRIIYSKRVCSYTRNSDGEIVLEFSDGSKALCDLLAGADGIKSTIRGLFLHDMADSFQRTDQPQEALDALAAIHPVWTGSIVYRTVVKRSDLQKPFDPDKEMTIYTNKAGVFIIHYPVSSGEVYFGVWDSRQSFSDHMYDGPWSGDADVSEVMAVTDFSSWSPKMQTLLKSAKKFTKWVVHALKPLPSFGQGQIALLGDAAHAMHSTQGAGGGQGIEDAYLLAALLGHLRATKANIPQILEIYDSIRRPFAADIARRSAQNGEFFAGRVTPEQERELGNLMTEGWKWCWTTSFRELLDDGLEQMDELGL